MELSDFVSSSLQQILTGVVRTQRFATEHNIHAEIAPTYDDLDGAPPAAHATKSHGNQTRSRVIDVQFDVAVTASDEQAAKAGAGIKVVGLALSLGASAEKTAATSAVSRITFIIPVIFPDQEQARVARLDDDRR